MRALACDCAQRSIFAPFFDHAGVVVGPRLSGDSGKTIEPKTRVKRCDDESTKRLSAVRTRGSQEAGRRSRGVEFAPDSPLEQRGFELPVPRAVEERCRNDKVRSRAMAIVGAGRPSVSAPFTVGPGVRIPVRT